MADIRSLDDQRAATTSGSQADAQAHPDHGTDDLWPMFDDAVHRGGVDPRVTRDTGEQPHGHTEEHGGDVDLVQGVERIEVLRPPSAASTAQVLQDEARVVAPEVVVHLKDRTGVTSARTTVR